MHIDTFREVQQLGINPKLSSLVNQSRRKFLNAANLLQVHSPVITQMAAKTEGIQLWPLSPFYQGLCERYIESFFTPQLDLIDPIKEGADQKWEQYFSWVLAPYLLKQNDLVRNILKAVGLLPCNNPTRASESLAFYADEMTLPGVESAWHAPDPEEDYLI